MAQPSTATRTRPPSAPATAPPRGAVRALVLATIGFALTSWAWALLSPLGPVYVQRGVVPEAALLVAVPVVVGSLGRIPVGALTDRLGGRVMFPLIALASVVPVLFLGLVGQHSAATLLVGGFFLGIAGTAFAIGVPYVNSWFPPGRRGLATGIFGASMGGTAISAFTTVPLLTAVGDSAPFVVTAIALCLYAAVAWLLLPTAPGWTPSRGAALRGTVGVLRHRGTWEASCLYALSFGGYVAFAVFLPTLLSTWYGLGSAEASLGLAGFVLVAVLLRPLGGVLADRAGAGRTLAVSYLAVLAAALLLSTHPVLVPVGTVALLVIAGALGLGAGAVIALVAQVTEPSAVGAVTGVVGAAGGLGGFVPPILMAAALTTTGTYAPAILLLAAAAVGALAITWTLSRRGSERAARPAVA
ncbi:nitrate/nitrite transporter [Brachybacterium sp. YJGR34]|uniref:MFS transporter n=1 Tax=Brachybacterium sp. YJGR34 TaxID=2059911 RepID=UPI000E0A5EE8|nr:MFS transporter [Brachybacterium sp. YJGR34]